MRSRECSGADGSDDVAHMSAHRGEIDAAARRSSLPMRAVAQ